VGAQQRANDILSRAVVTLAWPPVEEDASLTYWRRRFREAGDVDAFARAINPPILVCITSGSSDLARVWGSSVQAEDVAIIEDGRHRSTTAREAGATVIRVEARLDGDACWCGTSHEYWPLGHPLIMGPRRPENPTPGICPGCGTHRRITALVRLQQ